MHSPTNLDASQLVKIVVICTKTRVPEPKGHKDTFLSE